MLKFLNIYAGQITHFGEKVVKVAPVLWKETDHHIKSSEPTQDTLIVTYLKNPCYIFEKLMEKFYSVFTECLTWFKFCKIVYVVVVNLIKFWF